MRIVLPGGSGQVGTILAREFHRNGHDVVVLSRSPVRAPWRVAEWDARSAGEWDAELDGSDVVVNLAGRTVNCRYTAENRKAIMDSRVESTRAVGAAIAKAVRPPRLWLQMSTATIYSHRFDAPNDDISGVIGGEERGAPSAWQFSIEVARAWEKAATDVELPGTRLVLLRSAMVMSPDRGGVFDTLLTLVRLGLGGPVAGGTQYVSWIHEADFVRAVNFLVNRENLSGAVNLSSPNPLPYAQFMSAVRAAWGMPIGLPATRWMLEIGTWAMRSESELVLKSRRVVPRRLLDAGFEFQYEKWDAAARELCARRKRGGAVQLQA